MIMHDKQIGDIYLKLIQCGEQECDQGHFFGPYIRDHHLFHYVCEGCGIYIINGKEYKIEKGGMFYIPPLVKTFYQADNENPWHYKWIGLSGILVSNHLSRSVLSDKNHVIQCDDDIKDIIDAILQEADPDNETNLRIPAYILLFLNEILKKGVYEPGQKTTQQIYCEKAVEYIEKYIYKKVTVNDLAEYIGIDRSYLANCFKKMLGVSPKEYIVDAKVKKAIEYLLTSPNSISDIANSVGYEDLYLFSNLFRSKTGMSPRNYRKLHKKV